MIEVKCLDCGYWDDHEPGAKFCTECGKALTRGAYSPGYPDCLKAAGATVLRYEKFGSYQGDWWAEVEFEGRRGFVRGSYGSCGGCDLLADRFVTEEELVRYGKEYLGAMRTLEQAIEEAGENIDWDLEAIDMVLWVDPTQDRAALESAREAE